MPAQWVWVSFVELVSEADYLYCSSQADAFGKIISDHWGSLSMFFQCSGGELIKD